MSLPQYDAEYLEGRGLVYEVTVDGGITCVVLKGWRLPKGYSREVADLLLRLPVGYPDTAPDMWWFDPAIQLVDGTAVPQTQVVEQHLGRSWQRWSRHFAPGQWQSGIDGLENYVALIRRDLERFAPVGAT
jgi:hypothetical protein